MAAEAWRRSRRDPRAEPHQGPARRAAEASTLIGAAEAFVGRRAASGTRFGSASRRHPLGGNPAQGAWELVRGRPLGQRRRWNDCAVATKAATPATGVTQGGRAGATSIACSSAKPNHPPPTRADAAREPIPETPHPSGHPRRPQADPFGARSIRVAARGRRTLRHTVSSALGQYPVDCVLVIDGSLEDSRH